MAHSEDGNSVSQNVRIDIYIVKGASQSAYVRWYIDPILQIWASEVLQHKISSPQGIAFHLRRYEVKSAAKPLRNKIYLHYHVASRIQISSTQPSPPPHRPAPSHSFPSRPVYACM
jgi:hypothetical protein